jgi:hypothetical protein
MELAEVPVRLWTSVLVCWTLGSTTKRFGLLDC